VFNQKTVDVIKHHVLISVFDENYAAVFAAERFVRLCCQRQSVQGRVAFCITEFIDRVSFFVDALDNAVRSLVELGPEKARYGRITLIGRGQSERCKAFLAVGNEPRIHEIKLNELLPLAYTNARTGLPQIPEKIQMPNIDESVRAVIGRKTAAICQNSRSLFLNIDDDVACRCTVRLRHWRLWF